jgi:hypothetical protein
MKIVQDIKDFNLIFSASTKLLKDKNEIKTKAKEEK